MRPLTPGQKRVLDFIRVWVDRRGYPPTHAEIAQGLGFRSPNAAAEHVRLLAKKGVLEVEPGVSRGLRLLEVDGRGDERRAGLPLVGHVAAGQPILAEAHVERTVDVDGSMFRPHADYLLRVRGTSMIDEGIRPDDLVAVHRTPEARSGEIVVVRLEDEVTVKRWRRGRGRGDGRKIILEPANAALSPMEVDPRRVTVAVEGRVVGLLRLGT